MASTYEPIATTTLGSVTTTVSFSSISSAYTDLIVISSFGNSSAANDFRIRVNGDSGSNYSFTVLAGNGSSASSHRGTSTNYIAGFYPAGSDTSTNTVIHQLQNYSNTSTYKTILSRSNAAGHEVNAIVGLWRNTSAINAIELFTTGADLTVGSTFTLYGIKAA